MVHSCPPYYSQSTLSNKGDSDYAEAQMKNNQCHDYMISSDENADFSIGSNIISIAEVRESCVTDQHDKYQSTLTNPGHSEVLAIRSRYARNHGIEQDKTAVLYMTIAWLDLYPVPDQNCAHQDLLDTLNSLSLQVHIFSSVNDFLNIFDQPNVETFWIIISGSHNIEQTISEIYHIRSIESVYICDYMNENYAKVSTETYSQKVQGIYYTIPDLIAKLTNDIESFGNQLLTSINIISPHTNEQTVQNLTTEFSQFLSFQLFIDILLRVPSSKDSHMCLVQACRLHFQGNFEKQRQIYKFEHTYQPSDALRWYSNDSFIYRLLNQALRCQHLDSIYVFRSYITDLSRQLTELHTETITSCADYFRVYRGQTLTSNELNMMRENVGGLISINSFCSTSLSRQVACVYAETSNGQHGLESILFEIDIDPDVNTKPFALISAYSQFPDEEEVLFSLGSVFRIRSLNYDTFERHWIVQLNAYSITDESLNNLIRSYQNEFADNDGSFSLLSLGNLLQSMGEYNKSETFYRMMLDELPPDHTNVTTIYLNIGTLYHQKGDFDQALAMYHHALQSHFSLHDSNWASALNNMGLSYFERDSFDLALRCYHMSLEATNPDPAAASDSLQVAVTYNNIGLVYARQKKYDQASEYYIKSLSELQRLLPMHHPRMAKMYNNIASVKFECGDYENALFHYERALEIYLRTLPEHHPDVLLTYQNLAIVFWTTGQLEHALRYFQRTLDFSVRFLPPDDPNIATIRSSISVILAELRRLALCTA